MRGREVVRFWRGRIFLHPAEYREFPRWLSPTILNTHYSTAHKYLDGHGIPVRGTTARDERDLFTAGIYLKVHAGLQRIVHRARTRAKKICKFARVTVFLQHRFTGNA